MSDQTSERIVYLCCILTVDVQIVSRILKENLKCWTTNMFEKKRVRSPALTSQSGCNYSECLKLVVLSQKIFDLHCLCQKTVQNVSVKCPLSLRRFWDLLEPRVWKCLLQPLAICNSLSFRRKPACEDEDRIDVRDFFGSRRQQGLTCVPGTKHG